jgi:hypothetical protein
LSISIWEYWSSNGASILSFVDQTFQFFHAHTGVYLHNHQACSSEYWRFGAKSSSWAYIFNFWCMSSPHTEQQALHQ